MEAYQRETQLKIIEEDVLWPIVEKRDFEQLFCLIEDKELDISVYSLAVCIRRLILGGNSMIIDKIMKRFDIERKEKMFLALSISWIARIFREKYVQHQAEIMVPNEFKNLHVHDETIFQHIDDWFTSVYERVHRHSSEEHTLFFDLMCKFMQPPSPVPCINAITVWPKLFASGALLMKIREKAFNDHDQMLVTIMERNERFLQKVVVNNIVSNNADIWLNDNFALSVVPIVEWMNHVTFAETLNAEGVSDLLFLSKVVNSPFNQFLERKRESSNTRVTLCRTLANRERSRMNTLVNIIRILPIDYVDKILNLFYNNIFSMDEWERYLIGIIGTLNANYDLSFVSMKCISIVISFLMKDLSYSWDKVTVACTKLLALFIKSGYLLDNLILQPDKYLRLYLHLGCELWEVCSQKTFHKIKSSSYIFPMPLVGMSRNVIRRTIRKPFMDNLKLIGEQFNLPPYAQDLISLKTIYEPILIPCKMKQFSPS
ncbi:unnamed protein product [Dimorphilus gyrociliatus]|uniref:Uncharacterized protein n=1 Tax=Dimorphilus gyrociliatus TaxID=2664684 RepID=A0A7I8VM38_9ANNE|nr:unnamed protein product [Dimorphilus gyrociliatus]